MVGATSSAGFPATTGSLQPGFRGGDRDGFVAKIDLAAGANPEPRIAANGIVNAASFAAGAVAPGEIVTVFGSSMGPPSLSALRLNPAWLVDNGLASTRMLFDGVAAPLIYASATQTSAIMPYAVAGKTTAQLQIEYRGVKSPAVLVTVADAAPGLFTSDSSRRGQGAILNQDYTVISRRTRRRRVPW